MERHFADFDMEDGVRDGEPVLVLSGELDFDTAPILRTRIEELLAASPGRLELDLSALTFIDSSGVFALVEGRSKAAAQGAEVVLVSPSARCRQILDIVNVADQFIIRE